MSQLLTFLKGSTVHTIVVNSQKGGSGKTMLVKHLAIAADVDTIPLSEHLLDGIDIGDGQAER